MDCRSRDRLRGGDSEAEWSMKVFGHGDFDFDFFAATLRYRGWRVQQSPENCKESIRHGFEELCDETSRGPY